MTAAAEMVGRAESFNGILLRRTKQRLALDMDLNVNQVAANGPRIDFDPRTMGSTLRFSVVVRLSIDLLTRFSVNSEPG
jgi:hypothetical protein